MDQSEGFTAHPEQFVDGFLRRLRRMWRAVVIVMPEDGCQKSEILRRRNHTNRRESQSSACVPRKLCWGHAKTCRRQGQSPHRVLQWARAVLPGPDRREI